MTREGAGLTLDRTQLIGSLFALIPVPVAVVDSRGRVILSSSASRTGGARPRNVRNGDRSVKRTRHEDRIWPGDYEGSSTSPSSGSPRKNGCDRTPRFGRGT